MIREKPLQSVDIKQRIDTSGLMCPLPVLRAGKAIRKLESGEVLEVTATDPASQEDMKSFCQTTGHILIGSRTDPTQFVYLIRKA